LKVGKSDCPVPVMSRPTAVISGVVFTLSLIVSCSGKTAGGAGPPADSALSAAPTGLTAAPESGGAVRLSWKAPVRSSGITGYTIYRDGAQSKFVSPSLTTYLDTTVQPSHSYSYVLEAMGAPGKSAKTTPVSVTTPEPPPMSEARVEGRFLIEAHVTKTSFKNYHVGDPYGTTWYFTPLCDEGSCNVKTGAEGDKESVLKRTGARYKGKVTVPHAAQCGSAMLAETETIDFRVTEAIFKAGVWLAAAIQGTFRIDTAAGFGCDAAYSELSFKGD
jgi:hypothetical protein